jgi:molybdenum cofactor guanylyltransferase
VSGIILAGGAGKRMGRDKALLSWHGRTLLDAIIDTVARIADDALVVGRDGGRGLDSQARTMVDDVSGCGPLAGLATGLRAARHEYAVTVSCDLPFLDERVLQYLIGCRAGFDAVVPRVDGHPQMLHAVYHRDVAVAAARLLAVKDLRLESVLTDLRVRWVSEEEIGVIDPEFRSFTNVNYPEDWAKIQESV